MTRSTHRTRRTAAPAIAAIAGVTLAVTAAAPTHAQISDGAFALNNISAFGTDDAGRAQALPFPIKFGDSVYTQAFVNNNGLVSFGGFIPAYTTDSLGQIAGDHGKAVVAPFFANVDTRPDAANLGGQGQVGTGLVDGRSAFIATWDRVGRHDKQFDLASSFEVLFIDRSDIASVGDFDIVFNYGPIEWTVAEPGDVPARVGFALPDGQTIELDLFDELPPASVDPDLLLASALTDANGGYASPGQVVFEVRNGAVATGVVPTPTAAAAGLMGLVALGTRRGRSARTPD